MFGLSLKRFGHIVHDTDLSPGLATLKCDMTSIRVYAEMLGASHGDGKDLARVRAVAVYDPKRGRRFRRLVAREQYPFRIREPGEARPEDFAVWDGKDRFSESAGRVHYQKTALT